MRFIKKTSEYRDIYREHRKVSGNLFTLLYKENRDNMEAAFGIVIKGKIGNAVVRNKLKRRLRAYLRGKEDILSDHISVVIIAKESAAAAGWEEINIEMDRDLELIKNSTTRHDR